MRGRTRAGVAPLTYPHGRGTNEWDERVKFSFVYARGRARISGDRVDADGRLYHLELPRQEPLDYLVYGECQGEPVEISVIDLLGVLRSGNRDIWPRAGSRAWLAGVSDYPHTEETSHQVVQQIEQRARERAVTWRDFKEAGNWVRARSTEVMAGTPTHLKLDEILDAADVLGCCPSELLEPTTAEG
jgi:hypothetical protein